MDKVKGYQALIKRILSGYAEVVATQPTGDVETLLAFDDARRQYLWLQVGWAAGRRVYGVTLHARIVDGKIRIEQDWTEDGLATDLLRAGVPREELVLAFHDPAVAHEADAIVT